jgi:TorA maturation chaperone TorD
VIGDRDLLALRLGYYDLFVGLLWREPAAELVSALGRRDDERIRAAGALDPRLGKGWETIARVFAAGSATHHAEAAVDEYTRLFLGPGVPALSLYESYYLAGRLFDSPLAAVRASLGELGVEKDPGYPEPEDFLAFELEVVRTLLRRQEAAPDSAGQTRAVDGQAIFLKRHLLVWGPAAAGDLARAEGAPFYQAVGELLVGFLGLERELVKDWGTEELRALDSVRQRFARRREFSGRVFDAPSEPAEGASGRAPGA